MQKIRDFFLSERKAWAPAIFFLGIFGLYYVLYIQPFMARRFIPTGDTLLTHPVFYSILYSLREFGELPWWDPSMSNGYPIYFQYTAHLFNVFSPHNLFFFLIFKLFNWICSDLNSWVYFYLFVYIPAINGVLLYFIARLLTTNWASAMFAVLLYYFSYFTLFNMHDCTIVMVLPLALFLLYGGLRYALTRTQGSLQLFLISLAVYFMSFSEGSFVSSAYWLTATSIGLIVLFPSLLKGFFNGLRVLLATKRASTVLLLICALMGAGSIFINLQMNRKVVRYRGEVVKYRNDPRIASAVLPVENSYGRDVALNWFPFPKPKGSWAGHDNRYLGIASLILIVFALLFHSRRRLVWVFVLGYLFCNFFLVQTNSAFYEALLRHVPILGVIKNMGTVFPRGGPSLLLILGASMGLDALVGLRKKRSSRKVSNAILLAAFFSGIGLCVAYVFFDQQFGSSKAASAACHVGICLSLFSLLFFSIRDYGMKIPLFAVLCVVSLFDLVSSQSEHLSHQTKEASPNLRILSALLRVKYDSRLMPDPNRRFGPSANGGSHFYSFPVASEYHNAGVPYAGFIEWLSLVTNPLTARLIENWSNASVTKYPDFLFCTGAQRVPFGMINDAASIDRLMQSITPPYLFVHEDFPDVPTSGNCGPIDPRILRFTFNGFDASFDVPANGVILYRNNYDNDWRLTLDGQASSLHRANFTYAAFPITLGAHTVAMSFRPTLLIRYYWLMYGLFAFAMIWLCRDSLGYLRRSWKVPNSGYGVLSPISD